MPAVPGTFWGGMFPETADVTFFAGHFPIAQGGSKPATVGALILESGAAMTIAWRTGVASPSEGAERRSNHAAWPVLTFEGAVLVSRATAVASRAQLVQYAAQGQPFSLGLPWESTPLAAATTGTVLSVYTTVGLDWAVPGVRVLVSHATFGIIETYIVSVTSTSITVADAIGAVGKRGADIMPVIQVLLDPQQSFLRLPTDQDVERWTLRAVAAVPGIMAAATPAKLLLADPVTISSALQNAWFEARTPGEIGNGIQVTMTDDALTDDGEFNEDAAALTIHIKFAGDSTTVQQLVDLLATSELVKLGGTWIGSDVLVSVEDEVDPAFLSGGLDQYPIEMGTTASLTFYAAKPVWDRPITVSSSGAQDSIQTRAQLVQLGSGNFAAAQSTIPDWGRQVSLNAEIDEEWQWIKKFVWYVRGMWRTFWLPSWRSDLIHVSHAPGEIVVQSGAAAGDFFKWYPKLRQHIQVSQEDDVITYATITAAVDNGNGTITLTVIDEPSNAPITLPAGEVESISWLELTRFASDEQRPTFKQALVDFVTTGRGVQR